MTPQTMQETTEHSAPILRWILQRQTNVITCQLETRGAESYELSVVPHWNPASAVIERFAAPMPAFLRHAEVASSLRENGWIVIDHVAALDIHRAA